MGDGLGDIGIHASLKGCLLVRVPFVVCRPESRHQQDRQFAQGGRKGALEPDVVAEMTDAVGKLRAAQQRGKRPAHTSARPARDSLRHTLLLGGHFLR